MADSLQTTICSDSSGMKIFEFRLNFTETCDDPVYKYSASLNYGQDKTVAFKVVGIFRFFFYDNSFILIDVSLNLVTSDPVDCKSAGTYLGNYLNQWWPKLVTHMCVFQSDVLTHWKREKLGASSLWKSIKPDDDKEVHPSVI